MSIALNLLIAQGLLGAFDTIYHHELRVALPQQVSAVRELRVHAVRAMLYGLIFAGLAWFIWGGAWLWVLAGIVLVEVVLTLSDFVIEDRSRLLPASERVLHTVLAINGGATFAVLAIAASHWWILPGGLHIVSYGWQSYALSALALGVFASGVRDALATRTLALRTPTAPNLRFGKPQHILVTGGTGFIGQALCRALIADGHVLTLLVRDPIRAAYLFDGQVRSVTHLDQLARETRIDVVINLAGERIVGPRWTNARKRLLAASRIDVTHALVRWITAAQYRPRLMISASAVGYYGIQAPDDSARLDENAPAQPIFVSQLCRRWEAAAREVETCDVPLALLRFGLVFGHGGVLPAMRLPFMLGVGGSIGSGKQIVSWVHLEDLLGVVAHLMAAPDARGVRGVYNVTAPDPITQKEFAATLASIWHRPSWLTLPATLLRITLGEQATLLIDGQRAYPQRLEASGYRFRFPRLDAALKNLKGVYP